MKHSEGTRAPVERVLAWLNVSITQRQWEQLEALARWLMVEAVPAGGLGPDEGGRLWERHLADSLAFARGWPGEPPSRMVDIGSGAGLPGMVLAVLWPDTEVTLLDRAQRRADLSLRAIRVIGIDNARVRREDVRRETGTWPAGTLRAVANPQEALSLADQVVSAEGKAVIGIRGSLPRLPEFPAGRTGSVVDVPSTVLDGSVSLLIMGSCGC